MQSFFFFSCFSFLVLSDMSGRLQLLFRYVCLLFGMSLFDIRDYPVNLLHLLHHRNPLLHGH